MAGTRWLCWKMRDEYAWKSCGLSAICSEAVLFICVSRQRIHGALMGGLLRDDLTVNLEVA